jgi:hypothetical protein
MKKQTKTTKQQKETQKPVLTVLSEANMVLCTGGGLFMSE